EAARDAEMLVEDAAELEYGSRVALGRMLRVVDHLLRGDSLQVSALVGDDPVILSGRRRGALYRNDRVGRPAWRDRTGRQRTNEAMGGTHVVHGVRQAVDARQGLVLRDRFLDPALDGHGKRDQPAKHAQNQGRDPEAAAVRGGDEN